MSSIVLIAAVGLMLIFAQWQCPGQLLSLPGVTALTAGIYFLYFPLLVHLSGVDFYLGTSLKSLGEVQFVAALYLLGALLAAMVQSAWPAAGSHPHQVNTGLQPFGRMYRVLWVFCALIIVFLVATGSIGIGNDDAERGSAGTGNFKFLGLVFDLLIPLTVYYMAVRGFTARAITLATVTLGVFVVIGFRYRMVILAGSLFLLIHLRLNRRVHPLLVAAVSIIAFAASTAIGITRTYGSGLSFERLGDIPLRELFFDARGEIGVLYALDNIVTHQNQLPQIWYDPWLIALQRLVPTAIWPDKPLAEYLEYVNVGFDPLSSIGAGVAGPQVGEFLLQFGWIGVPILSFVYFSAAYAVMRMASTRGTPMRQTVASIAPFLFGFYMQTRGYFFQVLVTFLVTLLPVFLFAGRRRTD